MCLTCQQSAIVADVSGRLRGPRLQAWEKLQTVTEQLRRETSRVLSTESGLSAPEFTVLAHLAASPHGLRSAQCARKIGWDTSRLSHQLRRLEQRGYIMRGDGDGSDGRATVVQLTPEGRRAHRTAVGPHLESAEQWFGAALTDTQIDNLLAVLLTLEAHIESRTTATLARKDDQK